MGRNPAETLLSLRKRLETLPARAPERRQEVGRIAALLFKTPVLNLASFDTFLDRLPEHCVHSWRRANSPS